MTELIIIKTDNSQAIKKLLAEKQINYEVYHEENMNWQKQEKKALQEWQKLSDEELIKEWEKLPHNGWENN